MLFHSLIGDLLPVRPGLAIHPLPLAASAAYGLLIALTFSIPPLARAKLHPAAALFRATVDRPFGIDLSSAAVAGGAALAIVLLAVLSAPEPLFAAAVLGTVAGALLLLCAIGGAIRWLVRRLPRPRQPLVRMALANLHRPGAQTIALVIALGLSLSLFVTLAAIQTSLRAEISRAAPARAPDQFVIDIPAEDRARFEATVRTHAPSMRLNIVPTLRGTITAYGGHRVADLAQLPGDEPFLFRERGITYSEQLPDSSELVAGRWWPRGYAGPPLVSLDQRAAETLEVQVGDALTVNVLGREIEARIASLRRVKWESLGLNFIMVFSPNSLAGAPHSVAATITHDGGRSPGLTGAILKTFPSASVIEVGDVLGRVGTILDQMATAILLSASVTILAGIAVLVGAIAASHQARSYDSVVLKTLGATRWQILAVQALEYGLLAVLLALVALAFGLAAGWYVIVQLFEFTWAPDWPTVFGTLAAGTLLTLGAGLVGSWPLMSVRPAQALRSV